MLTHKLVLGLRVEGRDDDVSQSCRVKFCADKLCQSPLCCSWDHKHVTVVVGVVVEQTTALMVYVSCPGYEMPGRSSFSFHSFHNSMALWGLVAIW